MFKNNEERDWKLKVSRISLSCLVAQSCPTLCDPMNWSPPGCSVCGDSSGKNTGVGCYVFLQGIFPTQSLKSDLLHWQAGSLPLRPLGGPTGKNKNKKIEYYKKQQVLKTTFKTVNNIFKKHLFFIKNKKAATFPLVIVGLLYQEQVLITGIYN